MIKYSPTLVLIQLKEIDLIENPVFDFSIKDTCLLFNIVDLIIFKSLNKEKLKNFKNYISEDFLKSNILNSNIFLYESEISSLAFNQDFYDDIKKLEPFGTGNPVPTFLLRDLKIIKSTILNNRHVSLILKSKTGFSIKSISFNSINTKVGEYLMNYKNKIDVIGQINENIWNNKKSNQLTIKDLIL